MAGEVVKDAQGQEWRSTQGGQWRLYKNGKATDTLSKTNPAGGAQTGGGLTLPPAQPPQVDAGASQPTTVNNQPVSNLSPEGSQWLNLAWQNLQQQVAQGIITPQQAQQQGEQNNKLIAGESPALQKQRLDLQGKVQQGLINYSDLENQMYQAKQAGNTTSPETNKSVTADSSTADVVNQSFDIAKGGQVAGNTLTNPNQVNPFGSSNVTYDPVTGQPTVTQSLSQPNQNVLSGVQGTSVGASQVAQGLLGNQYNQFVQGAGPQSGYSDPELEKAIYARLTQGMDDKFAREEEQLSQTLANRGIGVGSGEAYTNAMKDFRESKNTAYENARNNATVQGTQTALQRQGTNVGALSALTGGVGTLGQVGQAGFYQPNFQGFNAVSYQQPDVQGLYNTQYAGQLTREQIEAQLEQQRIQSGATLGAAGISAEASKHNANLAHSNQPQTTGFNSKPPGS